MPIPLPNLDNRTFENLVDEMRALIPRYAPDWTDHNLSDPGMTLIDLFAWLAEAMIYRLNRIPQGSEARFLELLGAGFRSARPATATLVVTASELAAPLTIVRGTPLIARTDRPGDATVFEATQALQLSPQTPGGTLSVRQTQPISTEVLGISSGEPYQFFAVLRPHMAFDPQAVEHLPLQVTVAGEQWQYQENLLESSTTARHFTLEPRLSAIRFGDGLLGRIPPAGAEILISYLSTQGFAGNITAATEMIFDHKSSKLSVEIQAALQAGTNFSMVTQAETTDGRDPTSLSEARLEALDILKQRWRAITAADFELLAKNIPTYSIARAKCVAERDLTAGDPDTARTGHVSIIVVPDTTEEQPTPPADCLAAIADLLDERRLITCRHHVLGPQYTAVRISADIVRNPQIGADSVRANINKKLVDFFHPLTGGPPESNQKGWPFGRDVYISEVYHILEDTEGVDYVNAVDLFYRPNENDDWTPAGESISIAPRNLVHFDLTASSISVR